MEAARTVAGFSSSLSSSMSSRPMGSNRATIESARASFSIDLWWHRMTHRSAFSDMTRTIFSYAMFSPPARKNETRSEMCLVMSEVSYWHTEENEHRHVSDCRADGAR